MLLTKTRCKKQGSCGVVWVFDPFWTKHKVKLLIFYLELKDLYSTRVSYTKCSALSSCSLSRRLPLVDAKSRF